MCVGAVVKFEHACSVIHITIILFMTKFDTKTIGENGLAGVFDNIKLSCTLRKSKSSTSWVDVVMTSKRILVNGTSR